MDLITTFPAFPAYTWEKTYGIIREIHYKIMAIQVFEDRTDKSQLKNKVKTVTLHLNPHLVMAEVKMTEATNAREATVMKVFQ